MKIKCICFCTHLHENAKKKRKKKTKTQKNAKKTKTHIFKNEDAYFQERRRKKKTKTKTQILGERCQLSSGEYCIYMIDSVCYRKYIFISFVRCLVDANWICQANICLIYNCTPKSTKRVLNLPFFRFSFRILCSM